MRNQLAFIASIALLLAAVPKPAVSQQSTTGSAVASVTQPAPKHYYRLSFVLKETNEGQTLNQRNFTLEISAEAPQSRPPDWWNIRTGTRIPVSDSTSKEVKYVEVGVNLDVRAEEATDGLEMQVTSEISSAATENSSTGPAPLIRQLKVRAAVMAPLNKPTLIFNADDPASKHRFELEVTPQRMK